MVSACTWTMGWSRLKHRLVKDTLVRQASIQTLYCTNEWRYWRLIIQQANLQSILVRFQIRPICITFSLRYITQSDPIGSTVLTSLWILQICYSRMDETSTLCNNSSIHLPYCHDCNNVLSFSLLNNRINLSANHYLLSIFMYTRRKVAWCLLTLMMDGFVGQVGIISIQTISAWQRNMFLLQILVTNQNNVIALFSRAIVYLQWCRWVEVLHRGPTM